jgi:NAD(P)-dependent dehydrogenase (short-subunit alcohol dehydrogenase family)
MKTNLSGKVVLITGADTGIGRSLVHEMAARGAKVAAGLFSMKNRKHLPGDALALPMDVTNEEQIAKAVHKTLKTHGRIDVLINNAGIDPRTPPLEISGPVWRNVLDVNLDGAWRCCQAVMEPMIAQKHGAIINVGSIAHKAALANLAHYHTAKAGLEGLTRALARDLGVHGIRVNCLRIGAVQVPKESDLGTPEEILEFVNSRQCIPGRLTPESVSPVFAFFASEDSADITGQCITVDRGWTFG